MSSRASVKRTAIASFLAAASVVSSSPAAQAGPLCEWLFGHHAAPAVPYAAGYPVLAASPVVAPAVTAAPYAAGYPYIPAAPVYASQTGANYAAGYAAMPAVGATALQMPAYQANYPAAAVGAIPAQGPGDYGYSMYSPPAGTQFPVSGIPTTSYYGTGNVYPAYAGAPAAVAPAVAPAVVPVAAYRVPVVTNPSTVQTYPGIPASRPGLLGGLSRFFGSGYQSSYYSAPVTYYRPVTTVDPATGGTTVVQQPCTSYQSQLQRSPVTTLAPALPATTTPAPAAGCAPGAVGSGYNPYAGSPAAGSTYGNSTTGNAPATYYGPPVISYPATGTGGSGSNGDTQDVTQPQLPAVPHASSMIPSTTPAPIIWPQTGHRASGSSGQDRQASAPLQAPALQPSVDGGSPGVRSDARPLPATGYPYQREPNDSRDRAAAPGTTTPQRSDNAGDRVAQADWGYKSITWRELASTELADASAVQRAGYASAAVPAPSTPAADPALNAPALRAPALNAPAIAISAPAVSSPRLTAPGIAESGITGSDTVARSEPQHRKYKSSGWRSAPSR